MNSIMFVNPILLAGLAGISVPILIHLLYRRRIRELFFPDVRFILEAQKRRLRTLKVTRILLLLARIFIVTCLALALARPHIPASWLGLKTGDRILSILLDTSYSMAYRVSGSGSLLSSAKKTAEELISQTGPGDRIAIFTLDPEEKTESALFLSPSEALEKLQKINITLTSAKMSERLKEISTLLEEKNLLSSVIYVITDMQEINFENGKLFQNGKIPVNYIPAGLNIQPEHNLSLEKVETRTRRAVTGKQTVFSVRIKNHGNTIEKTVLRVKEKGKVLASSDVALLASEETSIDIPIVFRTPGEKKLEFVLEPDFLEPDDVFYYVLDVTGTLYALVIDENIRSETARVTSLALNPLGITDFEKGLVIQPVVSDLSGLATQNFSNYNLVILNDCPPPEEKIALLLEDYVKKGGNLLVFAGSGFKTQIVEKQMPWLLPGTPGPFEGVSPDSQSYFRLKLKRPVHPALEIFSEQEENTLGRVRFYKLLPIKNLRGDTDIIAEFDNTLPAIVEKTYGNGRIIFIATGIRRDWSTLSRSAQYLPLIQELALYMTSRSEGEVKRVLTSGSPVDFVLRFTETSPTVGIRPPEGEQVTLEGKTGPDGLHFIYPRTYKPGFYEITRKTGENITTMSAAANLDRKESRLTRLSAPLPPEQTLASTGRYELSYIFVMALVLLVLAETILASLYD